MPVAEVVSELRAPVGSTAPCHDVWGMEAIQLFQHSVDGLVLDARSVFD